MRINFLKAVGAALVLSLFASGCATSPNRSYDYTAFKESRPKSILILPPVNSTPEVKASAGMLSQMSMPLAEAGYYVMPVTLVEETFQENGLTEPHDIQAVPPAKLQEIFGADAALYVNVTDYGSSYRIISAEITVAAEAKLVDLHTGKVLWTGHAAASSAEGQNNNSGGGLAGILITALVKQIAHSVSDHSLKYASITSARLLSAGGPNQILYGPRSPKYGTD